MGEDFAVGRDVMILDTLCTVNTFRFLNIERL